MRNLKYVQSSQKVFGLQDLREKTRSVMTFAVADVYEFWYDISDEELIDILKNQER
jgi:predicted phosphoribosyltransferase